MKTNSKTPLPTSIDGTSGEDNIAELFQNHYRKLFNSITSDFKYHKKKNINNDTKEIDVGICEVKKMIFELSDNKSCGNDGINAEHLKYASDRLPALLSLLINSMFYHGYLPVNMLRVTLVPIIKIKRNLYHHLTTTDRLH